MLEKFRAAKAPEIEALRKLAQAKRLPEAYSGFRPSFSFALRGKGLSVIAEYKRASPSKGDIELGLTPREAAEGYARGGARAMSVLTEERYFKGSLDFLMECASVGLPLLRKDFLFHPLQIAATAATPASALLLIVRMLKDAAELAKLLELAHKLGMEAVVEVFDDKDLDAAKEAGATIIQVNNRDLDTLKMDSTTSERLIGRRRPNEVWISASGFARPEELVWAQGLGYDAVLVGSSLMAGGRPAEALETLMQGVR